MHIALGGKTDAIILTGGISHSKYCTDILANRVSFLAPVVVMPGENEIESLAYNAREVLVGRIEAKEYV